MAFTSWSALRTAIKDAIANYVAGEPCVGEYTINGKSLRYRSFNDLIKLLEKTFELEALEQAGTRSNMVSYGRYRRFR